MGTVDNQPGQLRWVAETLATEAAEFVRRRRIEVFGSAQATAVAVQAKSTPTDPVTVVDTDTEQLLRERLAQLRPGDPILGEEGGGPVDAACSGAGAVTWVLDPIDGTVNFLYGIPAYAVSVAASVDGVPVAGAVADVVGRQVYSAAAGLGAHVVDEESVSPLRCSPVDDLAMTLLGTGFGYSARRRTEQGALLAKLIPVVRDVRRIGSAALDLCMVAASGLDAFYEHGLKAWDRAAGLLIAAEAGARVLVGESGFPSGGGEVTVAAAPGVADELIAALNRFGGLAPIAE